MNFGQSIYATSPQSHSQGAVGIEWDTSLAQWSANTLVNGAKYQHRPED